MATPNEAVSMIDPYVWFIFQQPQDEMMTYAVSMNNFPHENASERNGNAAIGDDKDANVNNGADDRRKKSQVC